MSKVAKAKKQKSFLARHKIIKYALLILASLTILICALLLISRVETISRQNKLEPFYNTDGLAGEGTLGEVVRQEPLGVEVEGGEGVRVLYRTQRADGSNTFSSGMVFIPSIAATAPRPIVAWAHGTLGLGEQCAPTRTKNPTSNIAWVSEMLKKGWVVTATDYAGFGTPGTPGYLVGDSEARDVLGSVRAARNLSQTQAGSQFVIWGHSQGGNSALFSANQAAANAPELQLLGTVASAPAAELVTLLDEQYGSAVDWVIGPLVATAWPAANPALNTRDVLTITGQKTYQKIANQCIGPATIGGLIRTLLRQKFFSVNPTDVPAWRQMAEDQSAPILNASQPLLVVESKTDKVVLPNTTALYIQTACRAGSNLASLWLEKAEHQQIPAKSSGAVIDWLGARFSGAPNTSACSGQLPVAPASS